MFSLQFIGKTLSLITGKTTAKNTLQSAQRMILNKELVIFIYISFNGGLASDVAPSDIVKRSLIIYGLTLELLSSAGCAALCLDWVLS